MTLIGRIGRDAQETHVGDKNVASFSVAHNQFAGTNEQGERQYNAIWFDCSIWRKGKISLTEHLTTGKLVYIEGHPSVNSYTDKEGVLHSKIKIRVTKLDFLGGKTMVDNTSEKDSSSTREVENITQKPHLLPAETVEDPTEAWD